MSAINKKRRNQEQQEPKKEETQPMTEIKPKTTKKRNAPKRVAFEETVRGVPVVVTMFEAELPTKDGKTETKTFGSFAEATEALKAAKLASKKWIAVKVVNRMIARIEKFKSGVQFPEYAENARGLMLRTMIGFVETIQNNPEGDDDERAS